MSDGALFVSVKQTAALLGISDDTVYDLIASGDLPSARFNSKHMVPMRAIELVHETAMAGFEPAALIVRLADQPAPPAGPAARRTHDLPPTTDPASREPLAAAR